jgi:pimeloyl-ACP methyl ester carboxylesterase
VRRERSSVSSDRGMVPRRLSAQRVTRGSDGVEIAYATHCAGAGEAPAVVLVHGWAGDRTYWDHQVDYLAGRNFVIAVDLGGHGASGLGRDEWNLAAFGDDVLAVVDDVGAQRFALVGHSMGGDAIVHAARRLGDRVVGLVWVDVFRSLGNEPVSSDEQVEAFVAPFRADFEAAVVRFVRNMLPAAANLRARRSNHDRHDRHAARGRSRLAALRAQPPTADPRSAGRHHGTARGDQSRHCAH